MWYRERLKKVEAVQWTGENWPEIVEFCGGDRRVMMVTIQNIQLIQEGRVGTIGSWVIKDKKEKLSLKINDDFEEEYEKCEK